MDMLCLPIGNCIATIMKHGSQLTLRTTLFFDEVDIANKAIFKSKLQHAMSYYCTEKTKLLIEQHQLKGLRFDADLIDPF